VNLIERYLQHGRDLDRDDPSGWFVTEKFNSYWRYWDGSNGWSKSGESITHLARIRRELPPTPLDKEIYAGRGNLEIDHPAVQYGLGRMNVSSSRSTNRTPPTTLWSGCSPRNLSGLIASLHSVAHSTLNPWMPPQCIYLRSD
jgi:hypothetical protein